MANVKGVKVEREKWIVNPQYGKENVYYLWNEDSNYHDDVGPEAMDARARLMQAAPDLAEIVVALYDWYTQSGQGYESTGPSAHALLFDDDETLRRKILKATMKAGLVVRP